MRAFVVVMAMVLAMNITVFSAGEGAESVIPAYEKRR